MRINQFIARSGITSRRGADILIGEKRIRINGRVITKLGLVVEPDSDLVEYKHNNVWNKVTLVQEKTTYGFYKPRGVVTSLKREKKERIVADFFPQNEGLFPIGRLDRDSEGLLIITNDGELAQKILDKKNRINKIYEVICQVPRVDKKEQIETKLRRFLTGVRIKGVLHKAEDVQLLDIRSGGIIKVRMTLLEGRNRQIRRMMGSIRFDVLQLFRTTIGKLILEHLHIKPGKTKLLSNEEKNLLLNNPA